MYDDTTRTSDWFPWRSREQLLISAWQEVHDISIKCLDDLLHLLHEPGFDIQKLPTSAYLIRKHVRDSLPIIVPGDYILFICKLTCLNWFVHSLVCFLS